MIPQIFIIKKYGSLKKCLKSAKYSIMHCHEEDSNKCKVYYKMYFYAYIMQGFPLRMILPRRLKEMYTVCFLYFHDSLQLFFCENSKLYVLKKLNLREIFNLTLKSSYFISLRSSLQYNPLWVTLYL